jgi:hypothetical protein
MIQPVPHEPPPPEAATPDVPGLRSWRAVYVFVVVAFVVMVLLLDVFTRAFA